MTSSLGCLSAHRINQLISNCGKCCEGDTLEECDRKAKRMEHLRGDHSDTGQEGAPTVLVGM